MQTKSTGVNPMHTLQRMHNEVVLQCKYKRLQMVCKRAWSPSTTVATVSGIQKGLLCKSGYSKLWPNLCCHGNQYKI